MNAPVGRNDLQQTLGIGGAELREHPVLHDPLHDGMAAPELFQHLGIGGVAGLGLFDRGQLQLFEQNFPQFFGGIDVEFLARIGVYGRLTGVDALCQHVSEVCQRLSVHRHAGVLHGREHAAQGQVNVVVDPVQIQGEELFLQDRAQLPQGEGLCGGIARQLPGKILQGQLVQAVVPRGGVEHIARQGRIEEALSEGQIQSVQGMAEIFKIAHGFRGVPAEQRGEIILVFGNRHADHARFAGQGDLPVPDPQSAGGLHRGQSLQRVHLLL